MEIPRGCRISEAQNVKEKYKTNLKNFPEGQEGGKLNQKTFQVNGLDIFWNNELTVLNTLNVDYVKKKKHLLSS